MSVGQKPLYRPPIPSVCTIATKASKTATNNQVTEDGGPQVINQNREHGCEHELTVTMKISLNSVLQGVCWYLEDGSRIQ